MNNELRGGAEIAGLRKTRLSISRDKAFLDYCAMENPNLRTLEKKYKKTLEYPPTFGTLRTWCGRYHWKQRLAEHRARNRLLEEAKTHGGLMINVDPGTFVAQDELRAMAAQLVAIVKEATSNTIGPRCQEALENSLNIARLAEAAIRCVEASEEMMKSVADKKAKEKNVTTEEREDESTDMLATALSQLEKNKSAGIPVS